MSAGEMADLVFELIDRKSGFDGLIMDNGSFGVMLVDVPSSVRHRRSDSLALNDGLNTFVDVVMGSVICIGAAFHRGTFGRGNLLVVSDTGVLLMVTGGVFFGHLGLVMTMFGFKIFVLVLGRQNFLVLDGLNSVLVVMNVMFFGDIMTDFFCLVGANRLVRRFRFDF